MSDTTTQAQTRLTTEDLKHLDIQELLNGIFAGDVDVKSVLKQGLVQIQHTEEIHAQFEAEAAKAIAAHERSIRRAQNRPVVQARVKVAASGSLAVMAGYAAVKLTNPIGWGLLALAAGVRTVKYYGDLQQVKAIREIERRGDVIEPPTNEEAIKEILGEARFETLLGMADTVAMTGLGLAGAGPAWVVLGVVQALITGYNAMVWAGASAVQEVGPDAVILPVAFRKGGIGGNVSHVGRPNLGVV